MYNNFTFNTKGNIVTNNGTLLVIKENHERIKEELILENELEVLKNQLKNNREELTFLGNHQKNRERRKRRLKNLFGMALGFFFLVEIISPLILGPQPVENSPLPWVHSNYDAMLTILLGCYLPGIPYMTYKIKKQFREREQEIEETEILNAELSEKIKEKERDLRNIKNYKKGALIPEDTIYSLRANVTLEQVRKALETKKI